MTDNGRVQDASRDDTLAGQRLRLASLEVCEERIRTLREQECDLEDRHGHGTGSAAHVPDNGTERRRGKLVA